MADKFLQVKMSDGSTMPLKIDSVVTIAGVEDTNAAKFTLTYSNGGTAVLLSQAAQAAGAAYAPTKPAQLNAVIRTLWNIITGAASQPWNQPIYGGDNYIWDNSSVQPASSVADSATAANPKNPALAGSVFRSKQGAIFQGEDLGGNDGNMTSGWASIT